MRDLTKAMVKFMQSFPIAAGAGADGHCDESAVRSISDRRQRLEYHAADFGERLSVDWHDDDHHRRWHRFVGGI